MQYAAGMKRFLMLLLATVLVPVLVSEAEADRGKAAAGRRPGVVKKVGEKVGFGAGFAVTAGLAVSKKWNAPLRGRDGRPVTITERGHAYTLKARHAPVLGPKIAGRAATMATGTPLRAALQRFVSGVGAGATRAPLAEGKAEARAAGALKRLRANLRLRRSH